MARALLLYNPAARSAPDPSQVLAMVQRMRWGGFEIEVAPSKERGDLTRLAVGAARAGFERVVACGGDGTVREVVQGLKGSEVPLAVIPLGTANVLAQEMDLPISSVLECARIACRGAIRAVTVGEVEGEAFTFCASAGFDARAVARVDLKMKRQTGGWAYAYCGFRECLSSPEPVFLVELATGERLAAAQVFALKARRYGLGGLTLSSRASLESPTLHLLAVLRPLGLRLPLLLPRLMGEGLDGAPGVFALDTEAFRVTSGGEEPVQADGDAVAILPAEFHALPGALKLAFPR